MLNKLKKGLFGKKKRPQSKQQTKLPILVSQNIEENITLLKGILGDKSGEVVFRRPLTLDHKEAGKIKIVLVYIADLIDTKVINDDILRPLLAKGAKESIGAKPLGELNDFVLDNILTVSEVKKHTAIKEVVKDLLTGHTAVLIERTAQILIVKTQGWTELGPSKAEVERSVRGPQTAFSENISTNIGLIRRRIKSPDLKFEQMTIGRYTQSKIAIAYVEGITPKTIVDEVRRRLGEIKIDQILGGNQVGELIEDNPTSPFEGFYVTERPDVVCAGILEGRVGILIDGNPDTLLVPKLFVENFISPDDYYMRHWSTLVSRSIRLLAMLVSVALPGVYISVIAFHQEVIPSVLLTKLYAGRSGVPLPSWMEMLVVGVFFEALREANARTPAAFGSAISIIGALILGQASITAGILSPSGVIVGAVTGISIFLLPVEEFNQALLHFRFLFTIAAAGFGFYGMILLAVLTLLHVTSLRSFGIPFMRPLAPVSLNDLKDVFMRVPIHLMRTRPDSLEGGNRVRQKIKARQYFYKYQMWEDE